MNPATYLEGKGWTNSDNRITSVFVNNTWKITFRSPERLGQDTINYLTGSLSPRYTVTKTKIRNAKPPTIIVCDPEIMEKNRIAYKHTLTLWIQEKQNPMDTAYIAVRLDLFEFDDTFCEPTITIERYNTTEEMITRNSYPIKHRLATLRAILLYGAGGKHKCVEIDIR